MSKQKAKDNLELARRHLNRVRTAWNDPVNWEDLATYGFYCLEAAVVAAALHFNWPIKKNHPDKVQAAERLATQKNFPDISNLLWDLNDARKSTAYGDLPFPSLDAEDVASQIEDYIEKVEDLIEK